MFYLLVRTELERWFSKKWGRGQRLDSTSLCLKYCLQLIRNIKCIITYYVLHVVYS